MAGSQTRGAGPESRQCDHQDRFLSSRRYVPAQGGADAAAGRVGQGSAGLVPRPGSPQRQRWLQCRLGMGFDERECAVGQSTSSCRAVCSTLWAMALETSRDQPSSTLTATMRRGSRIGRKADYGQWSWRRLLWGQSRHKQALPFQTGTGQDGCPHLGMGPEPRGP